MAKAPDSYLGSCGLLSLHGESAEKERYRSDEERVAVLESKGSP
jgi:hypothetical protein